MNFEIVSEITQIQPIAVNRQIRDLARLRKMYGKGRWRKLKVLPTFAYEAVEYAWRNCIGMRPMGKAERK
jgi:hypothetical protein